MAIGKFEFRLERVREMRVRSEDEAKEELARAMAVRASAEQVLVVAASRVQSARSGKLGAAGAGVSGHQMLAHQAFLVRAERELQAAEMELSRRDAEVDARRVALQEAARERQVLDQPTEKPAAAHRRVAQRLESNRIDELALAMHRRRSAA